MLNKFRKDQKGFTLIELLIVVAIIGILAAIAIPQFAAYRQRAFNGSAQSDLRNHRTAQESLFADNNTYGVTAQNLLLQNAPGAAAQGTIVAGPMQAATNTATGAMLTGDTDQGRIVAIGIAISNGVSVAAYSDGANGVNGAAGSYLLYAKHTQGTRAFGGESENTGIFMVENPNWAGTALVPGATPLGPVASTAAAEFDSGVTAGGGLPTDQWFLQ